MIVVTSTSDPPAFPGYVQGRTGEPRSNSNEREWSVDRKEGPTEGTTGVRVIIYTFIVVFQLINW